jgi:hypothetical protein
MERTGIVAPGGAQGKADLCRGMEKGRGLLRALLLA